MDTFNYYVIISGCHAVHVLGFNDYDEAYALFASLVAADPQASVVLSKRILNF